MRLTTTLFAGLLALSACTGREDPPMGEQAPMDSETSTRTDPRRDSSIAAKPAVPSGATGDAGAPRTAEVVGDGGAPAESYPDAAGPAVAAGGDGPQLALSADFLNKTLTVFDIDKLKEGVSKKDVIVGTVDLSKYTPGALAQAITPDGKLALVSISIGFLNNFLPGEPTGGDGMLLFVDLEKLEVVGELVIGRKPMGIVITPDGKRAFVGLLSSSYFADVDIEKRTFAKVQTGETWNEELAIDETGTVAILSAAEVGNVKTFSVAEPTRMGGTSGIGGDAAGVAFFPGTKLAFVVQAPNGLTTTSGGYNLIDVADPEKPTSVESKRIRNAPKWYSATAVPSRGSVVYPSYEDDKIFVYEMKLEDSVVREAQKIEVGPGVNMPYGVCATPDGRVLVANGPSRNVGVVDLATKKAFMVPWEQTKSGPNDIKLIPRRK